MRLATWICDRCKRTIAAEWRESVSGDIDGWRVVVDVYGNPVDACDHCLTLREKAEAELIDLPEASS